MLYEVEEKEVIFPLGLQFRAINYYCVYFVF